MIRSALEEGAVTRKTGKKWFERFRIGDFDLSDRKRFGQPKKFEDKKLEQFLEENPTQTEKKLARARGVTQGSISHLLHCSVYIELLNRTKQTPIQFVDLIKLPEVSSTRKPKNLQTR